MRPSLENGAIIGQPLAAKAGMEALARGANAVDAAVTAALVAGVVALPSTGIGGYGGAMVIALASGKVTAIDFNTEAPKNAPEKPYFHGWLAAGVPGILAGLELALHRYGTLTLRQALEPAMRYASEGIPIPAAMAAAIRSNQRLKEDAASAALYFPVKETMRNPDLARMLGTLAKENSCEPFYRGAIGREIARQFAEHGGRVTAEDLGAYEALEAPALAIEFGGCRIHTAPLAAGGATVLQALASLRGLKYDGAAWDHARLEALRLAWQDRLSLFGDPRFTKVPMERLLAGEGSKRIARAVAAKRALELPERKASGGGTIHLSAADRQGNMVALTLTHGESFGACVTVPGLGMTLGHGMSRFEDAAGHPNAIGPRKRPLHNMCPTVVMRNGKPVLAVGATGGRRIPNSVFDVLARMLVEGRGLKDAVAAPRMNTAGGLEVALNKAWGEEAAGQFRGLGFSVKTEAAAIVQAVGLESSGFVTAAG